jgi:hypothetical protein
MQEREVNPESLLTQKVHIPSGEVILEGELQIPGATKGIVLFAHGSGSSRFSPRNQYVARVIREAGIGTLLFDLLTREEEAIDLRTRHLRFDICLLARRLMDASNWIAEKSDPWQPSLQKWAISIYYLWKTARSG